MHIHHILRLGLLGWVGLMNHTVQLLADLEPRPVFVSSQQVDKDLVEVVEKGMQLVGDTLADLEQIQNQ